MVGKTVGLLDVLGLHDYPVMSVSSAGRYATLCAQSLPEGLGHGRHSVHVLKVEEVSGSSSTMLLRSAPEPGSGRPDTGAIIPIPRIHPHSVNRWKLPGFSLLLCVRARACESVHVSV